MGKIVRISDGVKCGMTKSAFLTSINNMKVDAKQLAFDNRREINKYDIECDINRLSCAGKIWDVVASKVNQGYDGIFKIDNKGYVSIMVNFPITKEEMDQAIADRKAWLDTYGKSFAPCARINEHVYKVCHKRIESEFDTLHMCAYNSYCTICDNPLLRTCYISY